jgi:hypothetical protein
VLGVAAANANDSLRVIPTTAANDRPVFLVGHSGNGAGVDNIAVTWLVKAANGVTQSGKKLLHSLGFILICFAPKGVKTKLHVKSTNFRRYALY